MLPFKLVYNHRYDLNLGDHVFPSQKYRLVYERLLHGGIAESSDFLSRNQRKTKTSCASTHPSTSTN